MVRALSCLGVLALLSACSSGSSAGAPPGGAGVDSASPAADSGGVDSSATDGADGSDSAAPDSGNVAPFDAAAEAGDAAPNVIGTMGLFQLAGTVTSGDAGPTSAVVLEARASFHAPIVHAFDNRAAGVGCFADHYDATTNPAPTDDDAGLLRVSGYVGGVSLANGSIAQPVSCTRGTNGFYGCSFPGGQTTSSVLFSASAAPLGAGTITFGTNGGGDFGAAGATAMVAGSVSVTEDLTSIHYVGTADTTLDITCTDCSAALIAVRLEAYPSSGVAAGFPYSSVGVVECVLASAAQVTVPKGAILAMFASDAALDTVRTSVATLPSMPGTSADSSGNPLYVDVGAGVFGVAPR